jgi:hypothetical protein
MRTGIFLVLLGVLGLLAAPALAQSGGWHRHGDGVQPLDRLLPEIRRSHPGKFYDAEGPWPGPDGLLHYHLKWMTPDGRLVWLDTDARTGRVLGVTGGHAGQDYYRPGPVPFPGPWPEDSRRHGHHFDGEPGYGEHGDHGGHGGHHRHGW